MNKRKPFLSAPAPKLPASQRWAVRVVALRAAHSHATVFSVGVQHFTLAEGDREYCATIGRLFTEALRRIDVAAPTTKETNPNTEVTAAIFDADNAVYRALRAYERVQKAEQAIAEDPGADSVERNIAKRGVKTAAQRVKQLRAMSRNNQQEGS